MMGMMFTQEVPQAGPCTGDPPPQRARGSARNPGMRFSSQNLQIATHPHGDPALLLNLVLTTDHMIVTKIIRRALAPRGARLFLLQWNRVSQCCVRHNVWAMLIVLHQDCERVQKCKRFGQSPFKCFLTPSPHVSSRRGGSRPSMLFSSREFSTSSSLKNENWL